jgi:peptide deformylase
MLINEDTILLDSNTVLRHKSQPVEIPLSEADHQLAIEMLQYVIESTNEELAQAKKLKPAVGISAIQIGIPKQLLAIHFVDYDEKTQQEVQVEWLLANAKIVSHSVQNMFLKSGEGCLSVAQMHEGYVNRHARITVKAFDILKNEAVTIKAKGYLAIVLQHEIDHFNGVLYYDRINQSEPFYVIPNSIIIE